MAHLLSYLLETRLTFVYVVLQFVADFVELSTVIAHIVQLFYFYDNVMQPAQYFSKDLNVLCVFGCKLLAPKISLPGRFIKTINVGTVLLVFFVYDMQYCSRVISHRFLTLIKGVFCCKNWHRNYITSGTTTKAKVRVIEFWVEAVITGCVIKLYH